MSCPLAKITMIFFANFLYWKENRDFAANKILNAMFLIFDKWFLKQQGETRMKREVNS